MLQSLQYIDFDDDFWCAPVQNYAHIVIDVQEEFCRIGKNTFGTTHTEEISNHINNVSKIFREINLKTFIIYYDQEAEGITKAAGGLHKLETEKTDILVPKSNDNAFENSNLDSLLNQHNISHLLISGFNVSACVFDTAQSGLKDFYVALLDDTIGGNDGDQHIIPSMLRELSHDGCLITNSSTAIRNLTL